MTAVDTNRYRLFGLNVASAIGLPDLHPDALPGPPDVRIAAGLLPPSEAPEPAGLSIGARGAVLNIPAVGRYLIERGERITVDPAPGATDRNVRLYLLGSAFGAILHQRGLLPLHANSIDIDGMAVAFMGHSGAGKSTLASRFHDRGRPILGDDVCVVRDDDIGRPLAQPGLPRMRLRPDALVASGRSEGDYAPSFDDRDKFDVPTAAIAPGPLPLGAIYVLEATGPDAASTIAPLTGVEAVQALVANTYRGGYVPLMGGTQRHLAQCVALARRVPVFRLRRRWGLDLIDAETDLVEAHARTVLAEPTR